MNRRFYFFALAAWLLFLSGASTVSSKDFSDFSLEQKLDDFRWVVSHLDEFYGLMDFKESRPGFQWSKTKLDYWKKVSDSHVDREAFQKLMQEMVAELGDAHTAVRPSRDAMMNGIEVSTLGFFMERTSCEERICGRVTGVMDFIYGSLEKSPVKVGDLIESINGKPISDAVMNEVIRFRNLGRAESNLTFGFQTFTLRPNFEFVDLPEGWVFLGIKRGSESLSIRTRWFKLKPDSRGSSDAFNSVALARPVMTNLLQLNANKEAVIELMKSGPQASYRLLENLSRPSFMPGQVLLNPWVVQSAMFHEGSAEPAGGVSIVFGGLQFTLFQTSVGLAASYRVADFTNSRTICPNAYGLREGEVAQANCRVLTGEDYALAFQQLAALGVKNLILDLRSNGGGVLDWGYELVRAFSSQEFPVNLAHIRLTEDWVEAFQNALKAPWMSLAQRAAYMDILKTLHEDIQAGKIYSSPISISGSPTRDGVSNPWRGGVYVLVDEMCASMCDIFSTLMQDLHLGKVVGQQTMGAGGNIVGLNQASPRTKLRLSLTASRILRLSGETIENKGAIPDYALARESDVWAELQQIIKDRELVAGRKEN